MEEGVGLMHIDIYLCGLISACNWVVATIFLKFWRQTHDRLFLFFGLAFVVFGFSRMPRAFLDPDSVWAIYPFLVRFIAYACILLAIIDKNWQTDKIAKPQAPAE
jgi:hypothetical protein